MTSASDHHLQLRAGPLRLAVRPDLGGCIAGFWHDGTAVLRSVEPAELQASRPSACYPLVPYSNRIGDRHFHWEGRDYTTAPNFGDHPHSVHGVGWLREWTVLSADDAELLLGYRHEPDAHWPFAFDVQQRFRLTPSQLEVRLAIINTAAQTQPVGLGWHPYFPKRNGSRLEIDVSARWESDASQLPTHKVSQDGIRDHVANLRFDHCFDGWKQPAHIRDEEFSVRLDSSLAHLVIYTPHDKDYYCVEPVSHVNNAIQMADPIRQGLVALPPGATTDAWMTMDVTPL